MHTIRRTETRRVETRSWVRSEVADTAGEVAQTGSLPCRGLATRWALMSPGRTDCRRPGPLPADDTAADYHCCATSVRHFRSHPSRSSASTWRSDRVRVGSSVQRAPRSDGPRDHGRPGRMTSIMGRSSAKSGAEGGRHRQATKGVDHGRSAKISGATAELPRSRHARGGGLDGGPRRRRG